MNLTQIKDGLIFHEDKTNESDYRFCLEQLYQGEDTDYEDQNVYLSYEDVKALFLVFRQVIEKEEGNGK